MPFEVVDPIAEARELQEIFKDDPNIKQEFINYELEHIRSEKLRLEMLELRNKLVSIRKYKNISEEEISKKTGLTNDIINNIECLSNSVPSLTSLIIYCDAIGCELVPQFKNS